MKSKNKVHLIVVLAIAIFISLTTLTACNGTGMGDIGDIINSAISSGSDTGTDSTFCAHNYANGICTICGKEQPLQTEGLAYALNSDNASYSCIGMGTATATSIFIADEYNGLPVTSIGESAFYNCDSLTNIIISDSITSIGDWAFWNCSELTSVVVPNSVRLIGNRAFEECYTIHSTSQLCR